VTGIFPGLEQMFVLLPGVVVAISFHEYAHARVATWFGDPTPRLQGRVTLSPRSHVDILGLGLFLLAGFGWGRPVLTNPAKYRNRFWGEIAVSLAGVTVNFWLAVLFGLAAVVASQPRFPVQSDVLVRTLETGARLNWILAAFNLMPLPPLDGWHAIRRLLPGRLYALGAHVERWGFLVLVLLFVSPVGSWLFLPVVRAIMAAGTAIVSFLASPLVGQMRSM
jgi:Zn-dependent protease